MKKYLQYNAAQYAKQVPETGERRLPTPSGERRLPTPSDAHQNGCTGMVLDLSGKSVAGASPAAAMVTGPKWDSEQEAALDLSSCKKPSIVEEVAQSEALDLSKPSHHLSSLSSPSLSLPSQLYTSSHLPSVTIPPPSQINTKNTTAVHCSLLQAALNSSQSTPALHANFLSSNQSGISLDARSRGYNGGLGLLDGGVRSIKPFSSLASRPIGISVPHVTGLHTSVAVVQGIHKPMAITAPQPHVTVTSSKDQPVSHSPSSFSQSSERNSGPFKMSKSQCNSPPFQNHLISMPGQQHNGFKPGMFGKGNDIITERFLLQTPGGRNHIVGGPNFNQLDRVAGFSCVQCPKVFKTKAALKLHTTVHKTSEERQYECQICKRRFLHRHHLVVHQRKHSGEKPFKCNACNKTFMAIFLLHKHLRKHVRENGRTREISVEQLQQLHIKKMTSDGPASKGTIGNVSRPLHENLVVLSDEDEVAVPVLSPTSKHSLDNSLSVIGSEINIVAQVSAEPSQKASNDSGSGNDQSVEQINKQNESDLAQVEDSNEVDKATGVKMSAVNNEEVGIRADCDEAEKSNSDVADVMNSETITETVEVTEQTVQAIPVCTEDEELELDFVTGEFKVVPKNRGRDNESIHASPDESNAIDITVDNKSADVTDIPMENSEGIDNLENLDSGGRAESPTLDTGTNQCQSLDVNDGNSNPSVNVDVTILESSVQKECVEISSDMVCKEKVVDSQSSGCLTDRPNSPEGSCVDNIAPKRTSTDGCADGDISCIKKAKFENTNITTINNVNEHSKECDPKENADLDKGQLIPAKAFVVKDGKNKSRKGKRAKCEICSRTFSSNHHLVLHMSVHKRSPNSNVQNMLKSINNPVKQPLYTKTNINCQVCKKVFKFQKSLNSHMRVHSEKLAEQRRLSKAFRDFVTEIVPPAGGNTSCDEKEYLSQKGIESQGDSSCGELIEQSSFETVDNSHDAKLIDGSKTHLSDNEPPIQFIIGEDNVKRYVCHACDNTYTTKQKLKMHALIHKDNCYLCDMCGKSFFREVTLEKHIATHLLPRPHVCAVCKKSFIHRSSLMRHRSVHAGPSAPTVKQQEADITFEMKMLDTYTLLRQERLQQVQGSTKVLPLSIESLPQKNDVLDLSVRVKTDDPYSSMPPVLSPVQKAEVQPMSTSNCANLSPPLITCESVQTKLKGSVQVSPVKSATLTSIANLDLKDSFTPSGESKGNISRLELNPGLVIPKTEHAKDSEIPLLKKSRKTRVYQTSCRECKQKFPNVMSLKSHMSVHNMVETHLYECHICNHRFTQSCSLLRHLKTSCQENRLKCDPCGKTFHRRNTFEQHLKMHQVGAASLDGSFCDKRRDEAEIKDERESDIENNNTSKIKIEPGVKVETVNMEANDLQISEISKTNNAVYEHLRSIPYEEKETFDNETESDARTYLYSEGEIRTRDMSDFSDTEISPPSSPKKHVSTPKSESPTPMTLNLLSAVCSDIRNAEKENEMRRKELEERQKELETIEILANLRRGLLQSQSPSPAAKWTKAESKPQTGVASASECTTVIHNSPKSTSQDVPKPSGELKKQNPQLSSPPTSVPLHMMASIATNLPLSVGESKTSNSAPNPQRLIPTVAFEAAAEADASRKTAGKIAANRGPKPEVNKLPDPLSMYGLNQVNHFLFRDLHKLSTMEGPNIRERLSQLMKAQIPLAPGPSSTTSSQSAPFSSSSKPTNLTSQCRDSAAKISVHSTPTSLFSPPTSVFSPPSQSSSRASNVFSNASRTEQDIGPQDLSMKKPVHLLDKHPTQSLPIPVSLRERSLPSDSPLSPPPLVPVYNCDQCGMLLYNKNALFLHVQEHEFAKNPSLLKIPPRDILPSSYADVLKRETTTDQKKAPVNVTQKATSPCPPKPKIEHPTTLDLSSGCIKKQTPPKAVSGKMLQGSSLDLSSPTTSSTEMSDSLSSPSTPNISTAPNDLIRKELRCKIYSRRRSQGLEDLTVEFKSPEPSEMTEEERLKLNYRRECNRQAAQRSRMRKKDLVDSLLEALHTEEIIQSDLRRKMESLSVEKISLLKVLESHKCVKDKVLESHKSVNDRDIESQKCDKEIKCDKRDITDISELSE